MLEGKIIKGIGGFYYVEADGAMYECKAKGVFRKEGQTPLAGDNVKISVVDSVDENTPDKLEGRIDEILPRKNSLVRPPVANLEQLFIVSSAVEPSINTFNIDKLVAVAEFKGIEPIIVFTKIDLSNEYLKPAEVYEKAGFKVVVCNNETGEGSSEVRALLSGKLSAFTGNTGVGKSSLLNAIDSDLELPTAAISEKLGRGRHTTRHTELFKIAGGYVADTPGFSSIDFEKCETIFKDDLFDCFREFRPYFGACKFSTCTHTCEKGCAVCKAVENGNIAKSRHDSYVAMFNQVKDLREWQVSK